jgi:hypothetical protein
VCTWCWWCWLLWLMLHVPTLAAAWKVEDKGGRLPLTHLPLSLAMEQSTSSESLPCFDRNTCHTTASTAQPRRSSPHPPTQVSQACGGATTRTATATHLRKHRPEVG